MIDLKNNVKERIALSKTSLTKAEKSELLSLGLAQKIFYGKGSNSYRLYTTQEILLEFHVKKSAKPAITVSL